jgi:DNA-binding CsgD family transcriptional regulator
MSDRSPPSDDLRKPLTLVQWEIVERVNRGESCHEIAAAMGYKGENSVRWHIQAIYARLPSDLTADLEPFQAIIVWRRWLSWKGTLPPVTPAKSA